MPKLSSLHRIAQRSTHKGSFDLLAVVRSSDGNNVFASVKKKKKKQKKKQKERRLERGREE